MQKLADPEIFRRRLAPIFGFLVTHLCTLVEAAETGSFNGRDVHEDILAAIIWLNKPVALGRVEPLHNTCRHVRTPPVSIRGKQPRSV